MSEQQPTQDAGDIEIPPLTGGQFMTAAAHIIMHTINGSVPDDKAPDEQRDIAHVYLAIFLHQLVKVTKHPAKVAAILRICADEIDPAKESSQ